MIQVAALRLDKWLLVLGIVGLLCLTPNTGQAAFNPFTGKLDKCPTFKEVDGSPTVSCPTVKVTNGSLTDNADGTVTLDVSAGGAPTDATYITQTANATLTSEQALSSLATGYMKVTTGTGVVSSQAAPIPIADGGTNNTTFTSSSVLFYDGTKIAEDSTNLLWDDTNNRFRIGPSVSSVQLAVRALTNGGGIAVEGTTSPAVNPGFSLFDGSTAKGVLGLAVASGGFNALAAANDVTLRSSTSAGKVIIAAQTTGPIYFTTTSSDTLRAVIANDGDAAIGNDTTPDAQLEVINDTTTDITLRLTQVASQTGNSILIEDSAGVDLWLVDSNGGMVVNENGTTDGDLRAEGDTITDLLVTDASEDDIELGGHVETTGTAPTVSACGTTPSISTTATDMGGKVTIGTGVTTSCTITFASTWDNAPPCVVSGSTAATTYNATTTTTALTIVSSADMASNVVSYICVGNE